MAIIKIHDDFDLRKIIDSGQCFRAKEIENNLFKFITRKYVVYIKQVDAETFDVSCSQADWEGTWATYFDLETNYAEIRESIQHFADRTVCGDYLKSAVEFSKGIRILRQEPFETLISFIISQRKTIPAIRKSVELICAQYTFSPRLNNFQKQQCYTFQVVRLAIAVHMFATLSRRFLKELCGLMNLEKRLMKICCLNFSR